MKDVGASFVPLIMDAIVDSLPATLALEIPRKVHEFNHYGYEPNKSCSLSFLALFVLSTIIHAFQAGRHGTMWAFPTLVLGGVMEIIGFGARTYSSLEPTATKPFIIQSVATLVAPTPLLAADFLILGQLIKLLGPKYCRLRSRTYTITFVTCDIIAVLLQGAGGSIAAASEDSQHLDLGTKVALYGVIIQFVTMTLFLYLAIEFLTLFSRDRALRNRPDPRRNSSYIRGVMSDKRLSMVITLFFTLTCLYVRAIYRLAELAQGFTGNLFHTQAFFTVLDGEMMLLVLWALNFGHPGRLLSEDIEPEVEKPWMLGEPLEGFRMVQDTDIGDREHA
ncbi:RTA1-like protein [Hymenopellis radicata]|nr:RTA1-like protein [Hymenopellis radicata]